MEHYRANGIRAQIADNNNNAHHQHLHNNNNNNTITEISSVRTLRMVESRRKPRRGSRGEQCIFYDRTYPGYDWLLPGWIAEEHHMDHGRVYKMNFMGQYFHDTRRNRYNCRNEVLNAWEQSGLVFLEGEIKASIKA